MEVRAHKCRLLRSVIPADNYGSCAEDGWLSPGPAFLRVPLAGERTRLACWFRRLAETNF